MYNTLTELDPHPRKKTFVSVLARLGYFLLLGVAFYPY
ncbi:hypothetical protein PENANT_c118G08785 [Penicillium antarcticum]|uniref:Uncharacterized protein n=1 Tax=Penicillium antarcticum TaxID=416450 RepID=A0A1V6PI86_9EURO|nr:hypothetical protein PENANT_c118G08785 [Penicillium antarcticum]